MTEPSGGSVRLAERLIEATDWGDFRRITGGSAGRVRAMLTSLLESDSEGISTARNTLENEIVPQAGLYSVAEPAVSVLAASLADPRPRWVRIVVLDLMYLILTGAPVKDEVERGNGDLRERCIDRVRESLWVIARVALVDAICGDAVLDVLDIVDPGGPAPALVRSTR